METLESPIQIVTTTTITHYTYQLYNWVLNKEVTLLIDLYNQHKPVKQLVRKIEGLEYQAWTNDTFIVDLVQAELDKLRTGV